MQTSQHQDARYPAPPLTRWQVVWRYAIVVLNWLGTLVMVVAVSAFGQGELAPEDRALLAPWRQVVDLALGALAILVIRFRRRHPVATLAVLAVMSPWSSTTGLVAGWALVSLATRRRWRTILPGTLVYLVGMYGAFAVLGQVQADRLEVIIAMTMVAVFAIALVSIGLFVGARRDLIAALKERADTAEREQELRVLQGQAAERNRIAREMHDVLAHRMSLVSMHAGILAFREGLTPEETREIAHVIQENSHASLTELRAVLGSLREAGAPSGETEKPQPERLDVDDLVAEARAAGERVDYVSEVRHPELLPTITARHGYRIVQEALTNARKHAPQCTVTLRLSGAPGEGLTLLVRNPLSLAPNGGEVPGAGLGLVGVRERVAISGGRMDVRREDGFFELEVWLPW